MNLAGIEHTRHLENINICGREGGSEGRKGEGIRGAKKF